MKKIIFAISLMLLPLTAYSWESVRGYYFTNDAVKYTTTSSYSCAYTSTSYSSCLSGRRKYVKILAENYIASKDGDAYVYYYTWGSVNGPTHTSFGSGVYRMLGDLYEVDPRPPSGSDDSGVFGAPMTDENCQSQYSRSIFVPGVTADSLDSVQFTKGGGACSVTIDAGVAACNADGCYVDTVAVSTGQPLSSDSAPAEEDYSTDVPPYLNPVSDSTVCTTGSCVTIGGQLYHVDQSAIDDGSVSVIGGGDGSGGSTGGDGGGDTGAGGDGGTGSGSGGGTGTGDGSGTNSGDTGSGSGGTGTGGDGSCSGDCPSAPGPWSSDALFSGIEGAEAHQAKLLTAQQSYQDAVQVIRDEISSMFSVSASGGGGCSESGSGTVFGSAVTFNACQWIDPVLPTLRTATLAVAGMFSVFILLGGRRG